MINTFVMLGEVKRLNINAKPTKKGSAAVILVQYGPSRQRTDQAVQFLNVALLRVPPYVYEKSKQHLKVGSLVEVVGHVQGVLKQVISEGYVVNEMVADRLTVVDSEEDVAQEAANDAEAEDVGDDGDGQEQLLAA